MNRRDRAKKASATRKRRTAAQRAATVRKRRAAGRKATVTKKRREAGKKAALTRKHRADARGVVASRETPAALSKAQVLARVCAEIGKQRQDRAAEILRIEYPFMPVGVTKRSYGPIESMRVFVRDGFIDRYSGERLVFPPVLRFLSEALGSPFPFHPNWKADVTHPAYWELQATLDHVVPVTHGGADDESNWVTTSQVRNSAKGNWSLEQLGWTLQPPGDFREWDGLTRWTLDYASRCPEVAATSGSIRGWLKAAQQVLAEAK